MATPKSNKFSLAVGTGTIISIAGILIGVTTPEIRCKLGFLSESCPTKDEFVEVKLLIQTEELTPVDRVEVQFIPNTGAPVIKYTNSDGYVQNKIPTKGDIDIKLSKQGFQTLTRTINLGIEPDRTKTYILKQANLSNSNNSSSLSPITSVSNPSITASPPQTNSTSSDGLEQLRSNPSSLFNKNCQSNTPGKSLDDILVKPSNESVPLGREVMPLLAFMGNRYNAFINKSQPVEFVCDLNSSYKELKLWSTWWQPIGSSRK